MTTEQATVTSKDGTVIAYERSGQGPTVVLIAAALSDRSDTKRLAALLAEHYSVVNYDRRGRGRSTDAPTWSPEREIDDIEALIDANGGSAYLFGSSSGAVLALDAAAALGDSGRVRKVFSYEAPVIVDDRRARVPTDAADLVDAMVAEGKGGQAVSYFFRTALGASGFMVAMTRIMVPVWSKMVAMAPTISYDLRLLDGLQSGAQIPSGRWSRMRVPALVMAGEKAEPFMETGSLALVRALPEARREVLPGGHHGTPVMKPAALLPSMTAFFA